MSEKPANILWITCDEMRWSALPAAGNPLVSMPAAERLAAEGAVFENTFCQMPKCVPSRCSMLTGRYPHVDGFRTLRGRTHSPSCPDVPENDMVALQKEDPNLVPMLRDAGYRTCLLGKNHVVEWNLHTRWFDRTPSWNFNTPARSNGNSLLARASYAGEVPRDYDFSRHPDAVTADETISFLEECGDQPFLALVDMALPHPVYQDYWNMPAASLPLDDIPDPPVPSLESAPELERWLRISKDLEEMPAADRKRVLRAYYSMCEFADRQVSRILDAVDRLGLAENTLIIYTADHGDFAGTHNCYEKWDTSFLESIVHVPLMMRMPGKIPAGLCVTALVELLDLMPTVLDACGLPRPGHVQGKSLWPLACGKTREHKTAVFCTGGVERELTRRPATPGSPGTDPVKQKVLVDFPDSLTRAKMVRTERYKYIHRLHAESEFYDLAEDPDELVNRIHDPACEREIHRHRELLMAHLIESETDLPEIGVCYA